MTKMIVMEIKVKGEIVFSYTRQPDDFNLNDVFVILKEIDYQSDKKDVVLGVK